MMFEKTQTRPRFFKMATLLGRRGQLKGSRLSRSCTPAPLQRRLAQQLHRASLPIWVAASLLDVKKRARYIHPILGVSKRGEQCFSGSRFCWWVCDLMSVPVPCAQIQAVPQLCPHLRLPPHPPTDRQSGPLQRGGAEADGVSEPRRAGGRVRCHPAGCCLQGDEYRFSLSN